MNVEHLHHIVKQAKSSMYTMSYMHVHLVIQTHIQIKQELDCYEGVTPHAVLACFLIRQGADVFLKDNAGITALQGLPIQVAAIAALYAQQHQT